MKKIKLTAAVILLLVLVSAVMAQEDLLQEAYRQLSLKEYSRAILLFEKYLAQKPGEARIYLEMAYVLVKVEDDAGALGYFLKYLEKEPGQVQVNLEVAYLYLRQNDLEKAEEYFRAYLERRPAHLEVKAELAYLLIKRGQKPGAVRIMEEILQVEPGRERMRLDLAYALLSMKSPRAYEHFRILTGSREKEIREQAQQEMRQKPRAFGYMLEGWLYHSFRFDINVLELRARIYYRKFFLRPLEPYLFIQLSTDGESTLNPFPTIYSEQAVMAGVGVQWYIYRRNARLFAQYGYREGLIKPHGVEDKKTTFSYGIESYFLIPVGKGLGVELNNVLVYHSRFDRDFLFEGKEVVRKRIKTAGIGKIDPYVGILVRWDSKEYYYNNNYELIAGVKWYPSRWGDYYIFGEYKRGDYMKETEKGRTYDELILGLVIGIYR